MIAPIEATGLGKRFGRTWALRDCSIRVPAGKIAGLVGPNGAGKTTFLHLAAGLLRPSSGEITVFGRSPQSQLLLLLDRVGFVAQDTPLYAGFSVADMLRFGQKLNRRWDPAAAETRLRSLDIPFDKRISHLSGGQRSQVALALALGKHPELLLLDEPVARLDPLARREFMQRLTEAVAEEGSTVLLSSHVMADLERVCDYLIIIAAGQVQVAGDIEALLASHHLLVGPRVSDDVRLSGAQLIKAHHTERQSSLWIRGRVPGLGAGWREEPLPLEELVITYLSAPQAGTLPRPELEQAAS
ncbi:MAG TPA: ABC transporter ATP-binding protein [Candidatus Dormibacteraeota bacterium]|nr:ABC transporter ATP-binding protein [Candidatus Dormibacteraeota bacterium]